MHLISATSVLIYLKPNSPDSNFVNLNEITIRALVATSMALVSLLVMRRRKQNLRIGRFILSTAQTNSEISEISLQKRLRSIGLLGFAIIAAGIAFAFSVTIFITYLFTLISKISKG